MTTYTREQQVENRAKWVAALRSGLYEQGKGALQVRLGDNASYCCLGVACDLAARDGVGEWLGVWFHDRNDDDHNFQVLPTGVQNWLGLTDESALLQEPVPALFSADGDEYHLLTELNDHAGYTFSQIADLIESGKVKVQ